MSHRELLEAVYSDNTIALDDFFDRGHDINAKRTFNGDSLLISAVKKGKWEMAEYLVDSGIDLNITNNDGESALLKACSLGFTGMSGIGIPKYRDLLNKLVQGGANIDSVENENHFTPATASVYYTNIVALDVLRKNGANLSIPTSKGETCLILAAKSTDAVLFGKTLNSTPVSNLDDSDDCGRTAMHIACDSDYNGSCQMMEDLILAGADINILNNVKSSALTLAVASNNVDKAKLLLEYGATFSNIFPVDDNDIFNDLDVVCGSAAILTYYRIKHYIENEPERVNRRFLEITLKGLDNTNKDDVFESEIAHMKEAIVRFDMNSDPLMRSSDNALSSRRF